MLGHLFIMACLRSASLRRERYGRKYASLRDEGPVLIPSTSFMYPQDDVFIPSMNAHDDDYATTSPTLL